MRQLFHSQFKFRTNPILLNYQNNYHQFTFIENDFTLIDKHIQYTKIPHTDKFIQTLVKHKDYLPDIQGYDFTQKDLNNVSKLSKLRTIKKDVKKDHNQSSDPRLKWMQHSTPIIQLSQSFKQMSSSIGESLSRTNLLQSLLSLTSLNCLQLRTWQRLVCFIPSYYKSSALDQRVTYIIALSEYLKKFQPSINQSTKKPAFKFMYPQSYIIDLIDFRQLFKSISYEGDFITPTDSKEQQQMKLHLLENMIYLIMKATKKADMNIYSVRQYFASRSKEMILIAQKHSESQLHARVLYNIYFIYSYLNYDDDSFYNEIEKCYFELLRNKLNPNDNMQQTKNQPDFKLINMKSKQVNKLLSIWKLNQRPNLQIYHELIRPFLLHITSDHLQKMYYSNIGINLLTAGIKDDQILHKIVKQSKAKNLKDDEFMHMLKHYLNVQDKNILYDSDYHKCQQYQNAKIIKYLKDKNINIFSSCLLDSKSARNPSKQKTFKSSEHHSTQRIWSDIIKSVFEPYHEVIENASICNYEIDFLILAKNKLYAIQIEGGHYNKKAFNSLKKEQKEIKSTGKREVRQLILQAYNIEFVKIHCEQKLPTYIMQSRNLQTGKTYITNKMHEQTNLKIEQL